jgi:hypothetical protein
LATGLRGGLCDWAGFLGLVEFPGPRKALTSAFFGLLDLLLLCFDAVFFSDGGLELLGRLFVPLSKDFDELICLRGSRLLVDPLEKLSDSGVELLGLFVPLSKDFDALICLRGSRLLVDPLEKLSDSGVELLGLFVPLSKDFDALICLRGSRLLVDPLEKLSDGGVELLGRLFVPFSKDFDALICLRGSRLLVDPIETVEPVLGVLFPADLEDTNLRLLSLVTRFVDSVLEEDFLLSFFFAFGAPPFWFSLSEDPICCLFVDLFLACFAGSRLAFSWFSSLSLSLLRFILDPPPTIQQSLQMRYNMKRALNPTPIEQTRIQISFSS